MINPLLILLRRSALVGCAVVALVAWLSLLAAMSFAPGATASAPDAARPAPRGTPLRFVAYGDIEDDIVGFEDLFREVGRQSRPALGVVLGDIAKRNQRARESYVEFQDALERLQPGYPIRTVPGNHDRPETGEPDEYARTFGDLDWWFVHDGCLFVGLDNSGGTPTPDGRAVLREAGAAVATAEHVFLFLHLPVSGGRVGEEGCRSRIEVAAARSLPRIREDLGADIDVVFAAHVDAWSIARDDRGTLHVACGAEPGLGWPERSTPQIAAVCTVLPDEVRVEQVRVPYRSDPVVAARQVGHIYAFSALRHAFAPLPVWLAAVIATLGCWVLRGRSRGARVRAESA